MITHTVIHPRLQTELHNLQLLFHIPLRDKRDKCESLGGKDCLSCETGRDV